MAEAVRFQSKSPAPGTIHRSASTPAGSSRTNRSPQRGPPEGGRHWARWDRLLDAGEKGVGQHLIARWPEVQSVLVDVLALMAEEQRIRVNQNRSLRGG